MPKYATEKDIEELAKFLKSKKERGERVGLFLGHRAGVLYNHKLYEALKNHITFADDLWRKLLRRDSLVARELFKMTRDFRSYAGLPAPNRFRKCYKFLGEYFSEPKIHDIFSEVLAFPQNREEDKLMAELINAEFFDPIFTTNFDTSLEDNCDLLGMKVPDDYRLFLGEKDDKKTIQLNSSRCGRIIKVFGDFHKKNYNTVNNEFDLGLEVNQYLNEILKSELANDIIVLGYDPTWDKPVEQAFREFGGMLWYVDEKPLPGNTHMAHVLGQRSNKCIVGSRGIYKTFLYELSGFVEGKASWKTRSMVPPPPNRSHDPVRNGAFISYSHKDIGYLDKLQLKLKGYLHEGNENDKLDVWDDTKIPLGADWKGEIRKALNQAKLAVLLVSDNFLSSSFIRDYELPILYEAADAGEVQIVSIVLNPCAFNITRLTSYQAINSETEPLTGMEASKQDQKWFELANHIHNVLKP